MRPATTIVFGSVRWIRDAYVRGEIERVTGRVAPGVTSLNICSDRVQRYEQSAVGLQQALIARRVHRATPGLGRKPLTRLAMQERSQATRA